MKVVTDTGVYQGFSGPLTQTVAAGSLCRPPAKEADPHLNETNLIMMAASFQMNCSTAHAK